MFPTASLRLLEEKGETPYPISDRRDMIKKKPKEEALGLLG